jgi:WD40 repeat protein
LLDGQPPDYTPFQSSAEAWKAGAGFFSTPLIGYMKRICDIAISKDGKLIASCSGYDRTVTIWETTTGNGLATIMGASNISAVAFSPDGELLAFGLENGDIKLWGIRTRTEVKQLNGHSSAVQKIQFTSNGKQIVTGSQDQTLMVWDAYTGKGTTRFIIDKYRQVAGWAISQDERLAASSESGNELVVREIASGRLVRRFYHKRWSPAGLAFSPTDENLIVSVALDPDIKLWDLNSGEERPILGLRGFSQKPSSVAFSPDGKLIAIGGDQAEIKVWEVSTGDHITTLTMEQCMVTKIAFSPDGKLLVAGDMLGKLRMWEMGPSLKTLARLSTYVRGWPSHTEFTLTKKSIGV